jgi:hypothetical protein
MRTGFHFPCFGAWSYLADPCTPSGNLFGHAALAFDIFWFELDVESLGPPFSYLPFQFKVVSLGGNERVALTAIQAAIRDDFWHNSHILSSVIVNTLRKGVMNSLRAHDGQTTDDFCIVVGFAVTKIDGCIPPICHVRFP